MNSERGLKVSRKKSEYYIVTSKCRPLYKKYNYNLETLAEKIGVHESVCRHWFADKSKTPITWDNAESLAKVLDCNVWDIVGYDGETTIADDISADFEDKQAIKAWNRETIKALLTKNKHALPFKEDEKNDVYFDSLLTQLLSAHAQNMELLNKVNTVNSLPIEQLRAMGVTVTVS